MGGIVIQIAGLGIAVAFIWYVIHIAVSKDKAANETLLTTIVVIGMAVFLAVEILSFKVDASGTVTSSGLLVVVYQLLIKLVTNAAGKITYAPQLLEFGRVQAETMVPVIAMKFASLGTFVAHIFRQAAQALA